MVKSFDRPAVVLRYSLGVQWRDMSVAQALLYERIALPEEFASVEGGRRVGGDIKSAISRGMARLTLWSTRRWGGGD